MTKCADSAPLHATHEYRQTYNAEDVAMKYCSSSSIFIQQLFLDFYSSITLISFLCAYTQTCASTCQTCLHTKTSDNMVQHAMYFLLHGIVSYVLFIIKSDFKVLIIKLAPIISNESGHHEL